MSEPASEVLLSANGLRYDYKSIRDYCNGRDPDINCRLGLAHFAGGVGNADPKLLRMNTYLLDLLKRGPART